MKKYLAFTRVGFKEGMIYRADSLASVGTSVFFLVLMYYVWSAISASGDLASPFSAIIAYVALGQVISNATSVDLESWVGDRVREGTIVNELKKPASLNLQLFFYQLGKVLFNVVARAIPTFIIGIAFLNVGVPSIGTAAAFLLALFFALNLAILLSYSISMLVFWTKVGWSLRMMRSLLTGLFSGVLFPLYLLPQNLQNIFYLTPFPAMVDLPIRIYQGTAELSLLQGFGVQIFWIAALLIISEMLWHRAKKNLTVQGG